MSGRFAWSQNQITSLDYSSSRAYPIVLVAFAPGFLQSRLTKFGCRFVMNGSNYRQGSWYGYYTRPLTEQALSNLFFLFYFSYSIYHVTLRPRPLQIFSRYAIISLDR